MDPHEEGDAPLGRPVMKPVSTTGDRHRLEDPAFRALETQSLESGRHPGDELGRRPSIPLAARAPTETERQAVDAAEQSEAERNYQQIKEQLTFSRFNSWRRRADKTILVVLLAVVALLALFIYAQSIQILATLAAQPLMISLIGYSLLVVLLGVLAIFSIRLLIIFYRVRVNQQVSAAQLLELSRRAELRALAQRDKAKAKKNLEEYLQNYPFEGSSPLESFGMLHMKTETLEKLRNAKLLLLDRDRSADYDSWLKNFKERFQNELEATASDVIRNWMKLVAIKTAISPYSLVDSAIVLYCSYGMVGDLCRLYNLRMTGPGIVRLLAFTMLNTYAAGKLEDLAQSLDPSELAESVGVDEYLQPFFKAVESIPFAGKGLAKVTDGAANALLINKLGRKTISMLSPIDPR